MKNTIQKLREEFDNRFVPTSKNRNWHENKIVELINELNVEYRKFQTTSHITLLTALLEEVGKDIPHTVSLATDKKIGETIKNTINVERQRMRSIITSKMNEI